MMQVELNMRRKAQALNETEIRRVLQRCDYGVLCLCGSDGMPYGVPLNYVFIEDCFYFHCAVAGEKLGLIGENAKASLTVVDVSRVIPETFSTDYISVIAFGEVAVVKEESERFRAISQIAAILGIDDKDAQQKEVASAIDRTAILKLTPLRFSGKCGLEVAKHKADFQL